MIVQPTNHRKTTKTTTETNRRIVDCNLCEEVRETCCSTSIRAENWKHGCPRRTSVCTSGKSRNHCQGPQGRRLKKCQFSIIAYKSNLIQWRWVHRSWKQLQINRKKMGSFNGIRTFGLCVSTNLRSGVPSSIFSPCLSTEFRVSPKKKKKRKPDRRLRWRCTARLKRESFVTFSISDLHTLMVWLISCLLGNILANSSKLRKWNIYPDGAV